MKEILGKFVSAILLKLLAPLIPIYLKQIKECQTLHHLAIFLKSFIHTFSLFQDNKLKLNADLAVTVTRKLLDVPLVGVNQEIEEHQVQSLYDKMEPEDWTRKTISNYFLLKAFYLSYGSSESIVEVADEALIKAKLYDTSAKPLRNKDIENIRKTIKLDVKNLKKNKNRLVSEKIETEKLKQLNPISINSSHVMFVISLFSALFLVSGFVYNKLFFSSFGISVGDFFTISDYLASSVDKIIPTAIITIVSIAIGLWGLGDERYKEIHAEQFETEMKSTDYAMAVAVILASISLVVHSFQTGELHDVPLFFLLLIIILFITVRLPVWKYIENRTSVYIAFLSLLVFSMQLLPSIRNEIREIKKGGYTSAYVIQYNEKHTIYLDSKYIASNSNYVFLWNDSEHRMYVVPKSEVALFKVVSYSDD